MSEELKDIDRQLEELRTKRRQLIRQSIKDCQHESEKIMELPMHTWDGFGKTDPPWLICSQCGLTEEGWGCGYVALKHATFVDAPQISYDRWLKMRKAIRPQGGKLVII